MFKFCFARSARSARKIPRRSAQHVRPQFRLASLQALEQRTVLAAVSWINPAGGDWNVASNWSTGVVPASGDDVTIDTASAITITLQFDGVAVNSIITGANDTLSFEGGALTLFAASTFAGPLSMAGGSLTASGPKASLVANGSTSISGANLDAQSGGTLNLPHLTSYTSNGNTIDADGTGSLLELPALATITQNGTNENTISASGAGSLLDLPALATISQNGTFTTIAATNGAKLNLGSLASLTGNTNANHLAFLDVGNSTILDGSLTTLDMTSVTLDGTDQQVANSWIKCINSLLHVTGGSYSLSGLTDLDCSSLDVQSGSSLRLPGLVNYVSKDSTFQASGAGSVLDIAALSKLAIQGNWTVNADSGGDVKLDGLATLPTQQTAQISAQGSGSVVEMPSLANFYAPNSDVAVGNDGTVVLGGQTFTMPNSGSGITINVPSFPAQIPITLTSSGTFNGVTFDVDQGQYNNVSLANGTFTGGVVFNTTLNTTVDLTGGNQISYSGVLTDNGAGVVRLSSGRIVVGAGGLTLSTRGSMFLWTGGGFDASLGNVTDVGLLQLSGPGEKFLTGAGTLDDFGAIVQDDAGNLDLLGDDNRPATLKIERDGSYKLESSSGIEDTSGAPAVVINEGTISKTAGSGVSTLMISGLDNTGNINVPAGAGLTITGDLNNSYSLAFGLGSTLNVNGNFIQTSTGGIDEPIGGTPDSGQFGTIIVGKRANLGGVFALHFVNGYFPVEGQDFKVMTYASASGNFISVFSQMLFNEQVNPNSLDLTIMAATPHRRYVTAVYEDVLGREPDTAGLVRWTSALDQGASIASVAEAVAHSDEYYVNFVINPNYLKLLGRTADDAAVTYWTAKMRAGLTDQQFEAELVASDEFYKAAESFDPGPDADDTTIADLDHDADWVDAVYKRLLGRMADSGGETYWTKQLASGVSRGDVALLIANGAENNSQLINADYFHYLGRAADADGLQYWLQQFADGKTNEDVIAGFTGSAEYYNNHTS